MERKKLCLVIPSLQAGGMERVMSELAEYFASKECVEVFMVLYGSTREQFYKVPGSVIIHKPAFRFNNNLRFFYTVKTLLYLRKIIKKINPYSVLSFGEYWNSLVLISLLGTGLRIYVSDRCQPDKRLGKGHDFLRKMLYPGASGIIAQTGKAKEIYSLQNLNRNIHVIGNPVRPIPVNGDIKREKIVLSVGRLIKTKNHDKLMEIFLKISKPEWKLVIVGYDHLGQNISDRLNRIISENNAKDRILLEGKQADVETYYLKSSIFAFTSESEGFPNVIGEAMSAGLPVIAFDCVAGPSEMIRDNENGYLVPLFDYDKFRNRLEVLMENEKLRVRFGEQAREDIRKFSIEKIGEQYLDFMLS
jgi:glycosyltransferase involved in cell wall biosynthesis